MVKFGYNIGTDSISYESAIASMKASGGDGHLIMIANGDYFLKLGDLETIRKYLGALPTATLIIRLYHKSEGNWSLYPTAAEYENHWRWVKTQLGTEAMKRIVFDSPFNEPNLAGDNPLAAKPFVDYCRALVKAAYNAGVKVAIGAFSVGTPHEKLLNTVYVPLWQDCAKYKQGISLHLYAAAIAELGETIGLDTVLDPVKSRAALVDKKWPMDMQGWFIGRAFRIIQIWQDLGLGTPELYVTEGIIDNIFNSGSSHIKDQWREKFGLAQYEKDPRGAACWEKWLLEVFRYDMDSSIGKPLDFQQTLGVLFRHARKNIFYHAAFKVVCIFALNAQWGLGYGTYPKGTNYGAGSNFDHPLFDRFRKEYLPAINAEIMGETMPEPIPFPDLASPLWEAGTLVLKSATNVRNQPTLAKSSLITTLPIGNYKAKQFLTTEQKEGYSWHAYQIIRENAAPLNVWVAKEIIGEWIKDIVIPPPVPTLEEIYYGSSYGLEVRLTKPEWQNLIKSHEFMAKYHQYTVEALKTITPVLEPPLAKAAETEEKTDAAA
jgi:hypothetical protein